MKKLSYLERKVDDRHVEILDGRSPHDIDQDVLQVWPDVVVDRGDDGIRAHNGTAQDACALSETEKDQRCAYRKQKCFKQNKDTEPSLPVSKVSICPGSPTLRGPLFP